MGYIGINPTGCPPDLLHSSPMEVLITCFDSLILSPVLDDLFSMSSSFWFIFFLSLLFISFFFFSFFAQGGTHIAVI